MAALLDPISFISDTIAIANALGYYTPAQKQQAEDLQDAIEGARDAIIKLEQGIAQNSKHIKNFIVTAAVIEIRSRLQDVKINGEALELLIKLLFCIKEIEANIVFAIVVRYKHVSTIATLGIAATSVDSIEELVRKFASFIRKIGLVRQPKTAFVNVRIRGKYGSAVENFATALVTAIATQVCKTPPTLRLASVVDCNLEPQGEVTYSLLQPAEVTVKTYVHDHFRRVFLVGDTRTGKSTLGNALTTEGQFRTSKGMTGTMRIEGGKRVESISHERWVTEFFDTPGLNDKDGLDVMYQTAIEDQIRIYQRASTLILTIAVSDGITDAASKGLEQYKNLFGADIIDSLIVVLTLVESANAQTLASYKELNWPTVNGLDENIKKRNVFCVSLHDLRIKDGSASHKIAEDIAYACRGMRLKLISALKTRYLNLKELMGNEGRKRAAAIQDLVSGGWLQYDKLTEQFESSPFMSLDYRMLWEGFVMKDTDAAKRFTAIATLGVVNKIRKTAIHVEARGERAKQAWQKFLKKNNGSSNSDLMRKFGENLFDSNLGVLVSNDGFTRCGTLKIYLHSVTVFDPVAKCQEEMAVYLDNILTEKTKSLRPEVVGELLKAAVPTVIRVKREFKRKEHEKLTFLGKGKKMLGCN